MSNSCSCLRNATTMRWYFQNESVARVVFETPWLEASLPFRRLLMIVVIRAQTTLQLTGGKIYVMSLETFQAVSIFCFRCGWRRQFQGMKGIMWIGYIWLSGWRPMTDSCENSNEHSGLLKCREFLNQLLCFMDSFGFLHYNLTVSVVNICHLACMPWPANSSCSSCRWCTQPSPSSGCFRNSVRRKRRPARRHCISRKILLLVPLHSLVCHEAFGAHHFSGLLTLHDNFHAWSSWTNTTYCLCTV